MDKASEEEVRQHQQELLRRINEGCGGEFLIEDIELKVLPGVFTPQATDTQLMLGYLKHLPPLRILELTTGCGVISTIAGLRGCRGIACDINPQAVENARQNFERHGVEFRALQSNGFADVPPEKFDLIILNPPYLDGSVRDPIQHAFFGVQELLEQLFAQGAQYLGPRGRVLMTWAEWADEKLLKDASQGWSASTLSRLASEEDPRRVYRLDEWKPNLSRNNKQQ